jgi:hypothetical protein
MYEERERTFQVIEMLRKQIDHLFEENGKLIGHQNLHHEIQYVVQLKKEHVRLAEGTETLCVENIILKEEEGIVKVIINSICITLFRDIIFFLFKSKAYSCPLSTAVFKDLYYEIYVCCW